MRPWSRRLSLFSPAVCLPADAPSSASRGNRNGFDKLARPYRLLEYLTFGPLLWRTRTTFLPAAANARRALILGDGDGRFTAALLRSNPNVHIHAVDASSTMLLQLQCRAIRQGDAARLTTLQADVTSNLPVDTGFELVCTHFFLDCLTDTQCASLAQHIARRAAPEAQWIVSEFAVPPGRLRWPARLLIRTLYTAFRLLTGLRITLLPEYGTALHAAGFRQTRVQTRLCGILRSEVWRLAPQEPTEPAPLTSNHL